jgi:hypothetical protein
MRFCFFFQALESAEGVPHSLQFLTMMPAHLAQLLAPFQNLCTRFIYAAN